MVGRHHSPWETYLRSGLVINLINSRDELLKIINWVGPIKGLELSLDMSFILLTERAMSVDLGVKVLDDLDTLKGLAMFILEVWRLR